MSGGGGVMKVQEKCAGVSSFLSDLLHTTSIATTFSSCSSHVGLSSHGLFDQRKRPAAELIPLCHLQTDKCQSIKVWLSRVCHIGGAHSVIEYGSMHLEEFVALLSSHWASYVAIAKLLYQCQYQSWKQFNIICKTQHYGEFGESMQLFMQHIIGCLLDLYIYTVPMFSTLHIPWPRP